MKKVTRSGQLIAQIEELLTQLKQSLNMPHEDLSQPIRHGKSEFSGLTGRIYELIEEGFLNEPKTISDIQKKLKDRGTKRPTTALMPSLIFLIRKKVLDRDKPDKGLYKYFKK